MQCDASLRIMEKNMDSGMNPTKAVTSCCFNDNQKLTVYVLKNVHYNTICRSISENTIREVCILTKRYVVKNTCTFIVKFPFFL
jgi:hypothetical protein